MGDLFLVQLDSNGFYKKSLLADGTAKCAFFDKIVYDEGKLYLSARVQGDGTEMKLGNVLLNLNPDRQTEFLVSVNVSDFSVNYANNLESVSNSSNRFVVQNKGAQFMNGKLYFTGLLNGSWKQNGESVIANPSSNMLKGFILQIDPFTGIVEKSAILLNGGISAFFGIYASSNSLYAYGYDFSKGAILVPINKDTYSLGDPITVCEYGTVGNAVTPIVDGESLIMANRGGKARATDNKAKFYGSSFSFSDMKYWGTVYYSFKINQ